MVKPEYWGMVEYVIIAVLGLYFLRGFFRPNTKSVLSLILFPLTVTAYIIVPIFTGYRIILIENFFGLLKVIFISFAGVTLARWIIYFIFGSILIRSSDDLVFSSIVQRFPGACLSFLEGLLLVMSLLWVSDFFDIVFEKKVPAVYESLYRHPAHPVINRFNPIYDLQGAKDFKVVLTVFATPVYMERLSSQRVFRKLDNLPIMKKILADDEFQDAVKNNKISSVLMDSLTYQFLRSYDLFDIVTSKEMVATCRSIMTASQLQLIDEREGLFADLSLGFRKNRTTLKKRVKKDFIPDTKVIYKNGNVVEGIIVKQTSEGVKILLPEGELFINKDEIISVQNIVHK